MKITQCGLFVLTIFLTDKLCFDEVPDLSFIPSGQCKNLNNKDTALTYILSISLNSCGDRETAMAALILVGQGK